jgi:oligopeptide transport system permease protein
MENIKKNPLSLQLNADDFLPASNEEKQSLVIMRESVNFWKDGLRRLKKNKIAMVSFVFIIAIAIAIFAAVKLLPSAAFGLVTATILCSCGASANIKLVRMER